MRSVTVQWAGGKFTQDIAVGAHRIRADEETVNGGDDTGAAPHELLLAALGACTAMTLKVYADRKGWPLRNVHVELNGSTGATGFDITRVVTFDGELDAEQRQRLVEIADKCPVHKTLSGPISIQTTAVAP
ncbi:MAG: OsmC family protein [Vicinamibacterales bacterium]